MAESLLPSYPPSLTAKQLFHLTNNAREWSISHGLAIRPPSSHQKESIDPDGNLAVAAPVTLFPSLFPWSCFHEALSIQTAYNELYVNITRDEQWLEDVVSGLAEIDDFISNLWNVHLKVKKEGYAQNLHLGLFRSDYMIHHTNTSARPTLKQIEFNTIASSFGALSSRTASLHQYLLDTAAYPVDAARLITPASLPTNPSIQKLAVGLAVAHIAYGSPKNTSGIRLQCIVFVTQDDERNVFDQKHLEFALVAQHRIKVFRVPFDGVLTQTRIADDGTRALLYSPPAFPDRTYEVTTLYLRAGYAPAEYTSEAAWEARYHLERSAAVKCPSVLTHLAGTKKVQQVLATPDSLHLRRFLPSESIAERVRNTFMPMYSLDSGSEAGKEGRRLALSEDCERFVMKPQREGGGNNIYRRKIKEVLEKTPEEEWAKYVLMEMVETPKGQRNVIFRNGETKEGEVICELGVFGTCLWRTGDATEGTSSVAAAEGLAEEYGGTGVVGAGRDITKTGLSSAGSDKISIIENEEAGYLLRTKGESSEEGGVAAGFGAIDSCCLIDI